MPDMTKTSFILTSIFLSLLFTQEKVNAQNNSGQQRDSLEQLISNAPDDTLKIAHYQLLADRLLSLNKETELLKVAEAGLQLSEELNFPKGEIQMTLFKAIAIDIMGQSDKAILLYNESLKLAQDYNEGELEAKCYINLGVCYQYLGDYDLALKNQLMAYDLSEELSKKDLAKLLNNIGIIYRLKKKYTRAEEIYLKSYALKEDLKDSLGMAATLMNLGLVYTYIEGKQKLSIESIQRSQALYALLGRLDEVADSNAALGQIFLSQNNIPKAKEAYTNAWVYFEKNIDPRYSPTTLLGLGEVALKEKDFNSSEKYLEQAVEFTKKFGDKDLMRTILYKLGSIKDTLGKKAEAFKVLKEAYALNDTLNQNARLQAMEEMQAKFDVKEKVNELEISELKLNEQTRQRNIFLYGAIGLGVFALTIFFFLKNKIRTRRKITEQENALKNQKITDQQQKNKRLALNSMIEGQEAERLRIAKDLHDSLGGLLSTVKNHFSIIQKEIEELEKLDLTAKTNDLIDEACIEVRRISHNMIPHALSISGLQGTVEDMGERLSEEGYITTIEISGITKDLDTTKKVSIYRLIQEIISNIRKHAEAKTILIQLLGHKNEIKLMVEDDGQGFDYATAIAKGGLGLKSINSRVEFLDGKIDWDARPKMGTTVNITIPI